MTMQGSKSAGCEYSQVRSNQNDSDDIQSKGPLTLIFVGEINRGPFSDQSIRNVCEHTVVLRNQSSLFIATSDLAKKLLSIAFSACRLLLTDMNCIGTSRTRLPSNSLQESPHLDKAQAGGMSA